MADLSHERPEVDARTHVSGTAQLEIDPRYEPCGPIDATGEGLGALVDPWVEMRYPLNRSVEAPEGLIQHSGRWEALQRPDGSGLIRSSPGGTVYGIRTAEGTIVGNDSRNFFWPYRSAYSTAEGADPRPVDGTGLEYIGVPYGFVGSVLTELTDLDLHDEESLLARGRDEDEWVDGSMWMRGVVAADILEDDTEDGVLLTHESGVQVYVGWDSTSHEQFDLFGFVPFDGSEGVPVPSAADALDLLTPNEAAVSAQSAVERQGEWFLIPTDDDPAGTIQKPGLGSKPYGGSPLDNHVPRDWKTAVADEVFVSRFITALDEPLDELPETPQDVVDCVESELVTDVTFGDLRAFAEAIYVRGTIRHRENEHEMAHVADWRRATTHDWEVVTSDGRDYVCD